MEQSAFRTNRSAIAIRSIYLLLIVATLPILVWNELVQQVNASLNDILLWRRGPVHSQAVDDIVLVVIDDSTAAKWPVALHHSILAQGINRLTSFRPRALAIDLLLAESGQTDDDAALPSALRPASPVVLSAALGMDPRASPTWILPLSDFTGVWSRRRTATFDPFP